MTVLGYLGEPMFPLDRSGLWVNAASPTAVVAGLVTKRHRQLAAGPRWRMQRGRHTVTWCEGRTQALPTGVTEGVWSVPLLVDGHRTWLDGTLRRLPKPAVWPWLAIIGCSLVAVVVLLRVRSLEGARRAAESLALVGAGASMGGRVCLLAGRKIPAA